MELSQVTPSGCNLRLRQPRNQLAVPEIPSVSDHSVVDPATMQMDLVTPAFQPYRGENGRAWMISEYGLAADTSSLISSASGTEREDTDEEICSFDLGPEPVDPEDQGRLSADEWLDDFQQGLVPGGSQPRNIDYDKYLAMPKKPSILDLMRQDIENNEEVPPTSPERALTPTIGLTMITQQTHLRLSSAWMMPLCIPPRIQIHLHSVRDQVWFCYHCDHARHRFHRCRKQYNTWLNTTCPLQRQLPHQSRLRAHPLWILQRILTLLLRLSAQEEAGVGASGAHLKAQLLG